MSLLAVIGVILIVLKLAGLIAISWWLVLLPFYIGILLWFIFVVMAVLASSSFRR